MIDRDGITMRWQTLGCKLDEREQRLFAASVAQLQTRTRLQLHWRQWLTGTLITRWFAHRHFYQLTIIQTDADNPEARIAEDGRTAIDLVVDFSLCVINAVLAAVSFISILRIVGGLVCCLTSRYAAVCCARWSRGQPWTQRPS